jgi:hypothetical protein
MTRRSLVSHVRRLAGPVVSASVLAVAMAGCGEEATPPGPGADSPAVQKAKDAMKGPGPKAEAPKAEAPKAETK